MSQNANLCRTVPTGAASGPREKLVESRGVEPLTDATGGEPADGGGQPPRQQSPLAAQLDLVEGDVDEFRHRIQALEADTTLLFTTASAPVGKLRAAAAEAMLAGGLLMAEIEGERRRQSWEQKPGGERFLAALEKLREALS